MKFFQLNIYELVPSVSFSILIIWEGKVLLKFFFHRFQ